MNEVFSGIAVSDGIAIGRALLLEKHEIVVDTRLISKEQTEEEYARYAVAVERTRVQITALYESTKQTLGASEAQIFLAHLEVLDDPTLEDSMSEKVKKQCKNAELSLEESVTEIEAMFATIDDEYLKERIADIFDVSRRIMRNLKNITEVNLSKLEYDCIIVAQDLTPSETMSLDFGKTLGFATDLGGRTSHTAIMSRSLEIPAVVGMSNIFCNVTNEDTLILDALEGKVFVNPTQELIEQYNAKREAFLAEKKVLEELKELPAQTTDGVTVELASNIGGPNEVELVLKYGAQAIGLYRTEFLYMDNTHFPTEEEQFKAYKTVASKMEGKATIIRTLDIGGDKDLPYHAFEHEDNPFLGWRAIRICLDRTDIFKTQLRAILRASAFGKLRIMYPMIISVEELLAANTLLQECMHELKSEGVAFDEGIEVGIMIETPAAVILAEDFAKHVHFFSIGTNDLTQYTLAVDRGNVNISKMYNPLHPAVLRSIKRIIDASHKEGKWTGMCGEFAGDAKATLVLLGMGLDEFSMTASSIPKIKKFIRSTDSKTAQQAAKHVLQLSTLKEIEDYLGSC